MTHKAKRWMTNLATRLDRLEQILLDILARLPPPR